MSSSGSHGTVLARRRGDGTLRSGLMLMMRIDRWDAHRDGPLNERSLHDKLKTLGYEPLPRPHVGAIASARIHRRDRLEAVLAGLLKVSIDGESAILTAGDIVFVPAGAARRLDTVGTSPVHCIEAVFHPRG
jgi:hypothetical protein